MAEDTSDITNSTRKTRPSYRRNRDYGTHVTSTYELNKDLYTCYKHSEQEKPRYTLRLKEIWDQLRPQYAYMTAILSFKTSTKDCQEKISTRRNTKKTSNQRHHIDIKQGKQHGDE